MTRRQTNGSMTAATVVDSTKALTRRCARRIVVQFTAAKRVDNLTRGWTRLCASARRRHDRAWPWCGRRTASCTGWRWRGGMRRGSGRSRRSSGCGSQAGHRGGCRTPSSRRTRMGGSCDREDVVGDPRQAAEVRERSGGFCECCHRSAATEVHHLRYGPDHDPEMVIHICHDCHCVAEGKTA